MNEVYIDASTASGVHELAFDLHLFSQFLPQPMPSRSCLQAIAPGKGTVIEIECIAQA